MAAHQSYALCQTPVVPQTAAVQPWGVDVDPLVTGEEYSSQDALPYSWQPGGPITLASGIRGAKAGNVRQEKHNMKSRRSTT